MPTNLHLRLEYQDAVSSKRDLLLIQENLLNAVKHLKEYAIIRQKLLTEKAKLKKNLVSLVKSVELLEKEMPESDLSLVNKKGQIKRTVLKPLLPKVPAVSPVAMLPKKKKEDELERELREIKEKLELLKYKQ